MSFAPWDVNEMGLVDGGSKGAPVLLLPEALQRKADQDHKEHMGLLNIHRPWRGTFYIYHMSIHM